MDDRFLNALVGARVKVAGRMLGDLSLWHLALLQAANSPIVGEGEPGARDLVILTKILQAKPQEVPKLKPNLADVWRIIRLEWSQKYAKREAQKLAKWLQAQFSTPITYEKEQTKSGGYSCPAVFSLVLSIVKNTNETIASAWGVSIAQAMWIDVAIAEMNGQDVIISSDEEEMAPSNPESEIEEIRLARECLPPEVFERWIAARK